MTTTSVYRLEQTDTYCTPDDVVYSNLVTITVHAQLVGSTDAASDQTICYGETPSAISTSAPTGGSGTFTYQWQIQNGLGWDNILGANALTYAPGSLTTTSVYRLEQTDTYCSPDDVVYSNEVTITVNPRTTISGNFNYYKNQNSVPAGPVSGILLNNMVTVSLWLNGNPVAGTLAHTNPQTLTPAGAYMFDNLCPTETYEIRATTIRVTEGSVNSTDAALASYWSALGSPYNIEYGRFYAGDVTGEDFMQASDALQIRNHFVRGIPFDRQAQAVAGHPVAPEDWVFWKEGETMLNNANQIGSPMHYPSVTLPLAGLTQNIWGLCVGDFNTSFNPSLANKTASNSVELIYTGNQQVSSNQVFDLPIRVVNQSQVGAVSLILNIPSDLVEVQDVLINGTGGQLDWSVNGNELRIGWNSLIALDLNSAAKLVSLRLKTTSAFTGNSEIKVTLASDPLNELADGQFSVISDAILSTDVVNASAFGIQTQSPVSSELSMNSYPNPFNGTTTITYELPSDGKVTLQLYNYIGSLVQELVNEDQSQGVHSLKLDATSLPYGIYMATIKVKTNDSEYVRTIKLVNSK